MPERESQEEIRLPDEDPLHDMTIDDSSYSSDSIVSGSTITIPRGSYASGTQMINDIHLTAEDYIQHYRDSGYLIHETKPKRINMITFGIPKKKRRPEASILVIT